MSGVKLGAADRNKSCWQRRKRRQATSHQLLLHLSWEQIPSGNNVSCFTSASQILIKSLPGQLLPDILQWRGYRKHNSQLDQVGNRTTQHDSIWELEGCCQWGEFRVRSDLYLKCWYFFHHGHLAVILIFFKYWINIWFICIPEFCSVPLSCMPEVGASLDSRWFRPSQLVMVPWQLGWLQPSFLAH